MLLIPAIDLKQGQCVRLRQGRMDDATIFSSDPVAMAGHWVEQGAERLHIVDLDGAFAGKPVNAEIIYQITKTLPELSVQIGGGIRELETIQTYLEAGVDYTIIGTKAVQQTEFVQQACQQFPQKIMVGLDAKDGQVAVQGWADVSSYTAVELAQKFTDYGVVAIVYTDISRDGMMQGLNLDATVALANAIAIPVIASGGITNMDDILGLKQAKTPNIIGAITGRAIYEGRLDFRLANQVFVKGIN